PCSTDPERRFTVVQAQCPKFISVDKQADNDVMHFVECGETNGLSHSSFNLMVSLRYIPVHCVPLPISRPAKYWIDFFCVA
ncbi:MAG TPA: hypothetical protein P5330_08820, partial [Candidatus Competibacteraceae bacterium]|nr:hypothetical protein [Candidatus Competibacteraceae bacterium]